MRAAALLAIALAACDGADDDCDDTVDHLTLQTADTHWTEYWDSNDYKVGPLATAVGGSQYYSAGVFTGCGSPRPASPLTASTDDPTVLTTTATDATVVVRAVAEGTTRVHAEAANGLEATMSVAARAIGHVALAADELGEPTAFLRGTPVAKILLLDADGQPVVDHDLALRGELASAGTWNQLALGDAIAGDHAVSIHAGGATWPVVVHVVDGIDALVPQQAVMTVPSYLMNDVCFFAMRDGGLVAGVPWHIELDTPNNAAGPQMNCVTVWQGPDHEPMVTVTAHALGFTATTTVTFTGK